MAQQEVVDAALSLFEDEGDIGAILLECSDMPPYAAAVQEATQLPVFDFITLIKWLHNATAQRPYSGWIQRYVKIEIFSKRLYDMNKPKEIAAVSKMEVKEWNVQDFIMI